MDIELRFIGVEDPEYLVAKELRYDALYADWELPRSLVEDTDGRTYRHLVAFLGETLVGYARIHLDDGDSKVFQVCVEREYRGQGIAVAMMRRLIELAREEGRSEVYLDARAHARVFYEQLGFVAEGEEFLSGRTNTPHQVMRLRLE